MALPGVAEATERIQKAREAAEKNKGERQQYPSRRKLNIGDGEEVTVRFLIGDKEEERERDWKLAWVHRSVPRQARSGKRYWSDVPCLDQQGNGDVPCPGCELNEQDDEKARRSQMFFVNVIWRDAPVFERDENGKVKRDDDNNAVIEKYEDTVAWWSKGYNVAKTLNKLDEKYGGINSRDFTIKREGTEFETTYDIDPLTDKSGNLVKKSGLSAADKKLAADRADLNELIQPPAYEDFFLSAGAAAANKEEDGEEKPSRKPSKDNPFSRRRQARED